MESINEEIQELQKTFTWFLKSIEEHEIEVKKEIEQFQKYNATLEDRIAELENILDGKDNLKEIDCGIGYINYEKPDNLVLRDVMDNLEAAIKKHTPGKVNEVLEGLISFASTLLFFLLSYYGSPI